MLLTNTEVMGAVAALKATGNVEMSAKLGYKLSVALKKLEPLADACEAERQKHGERLAEKDKDGKVKTKVIGEDPQTHQPIEILDISLENTVTLNREVAELFATDNEVNIKPVKLSDFEYRSTCSKCGEEVIKEVNMGTNAMCAISFLIIDEESAQTPLD